MKVMDLDELLGTPARLAIIATVAISVFLCARRPLEAAIGLLTVAAGLPIYAWHRSRMGLGVAPESGTDPE